MKKTIKNTKNQPKYDYTLDFSKINSYDDLVKQYVEAKVTANKPIDIADLCAYEDQVKPSISVLIVLPNPEKKKTPWYKKLMFWKKNK